MTETGRWPLLVSRLFPLELRPKIATVLREGYGLAALRADAIAGLTVAIVALPLSMAIAIASGVGPERGLFTAIIGGFLVSLFSGSRYQVGGPAGAFIVLVATCTMQIGVGGLITATFLCGILLIAAGLLRIGSYIRFIPYPVTLAFTAGIGVVIFASQLRELFGLSLSRDEPPALIAKLGALWAARGTVTWAAVAVAGLSIGTIVAVRRWRPGWPGMLIAVVVAAVATALSGLPVETIGTRFGELPSLLPRPELPRLGLASVQAALPYALSFALLGAIESLLSAVVADGMSGARHRSNAELIGQGVANIGSALFGGFCVTGTIARTATNVRAGSRGPLSGMLHALWLLVFMLVAAPLASYIPLAALAGVLAVVAWGMVERVELWTLIRASRGDALIILTTFLLVAFRDLTEGILAGFAVAGLVFIRRMSGSVSLEGDEALQTAGDRDSGRFFFRLRGPVFFGSAAQMGAVLERLAERPSAFVLDMREVPMVDSSGARSLELLARRVARRGGQLYILGARPEVRHGLLDQGLGRPLVLYISHLESLDALQEASTPP